MANSIGWGQGAVNNAIGWGQGAINNLIAWGAVYFVSWAGETDIIGSPIPSTIINFKSRVATDVGLFEAEGCLNTLLTNLNNI